MLTTKFRKLSKNTKTKNKYKMTTKQNRIKILFQSLKKKNEFILLVCDELGGKPSSKKNHWFCDSGFWSIPDKHLDAVMTLLELSVDLEKGDLK